MDHLGYAQNLILVLAVAALGYWFSLLRDSEFVPGPLARRGMLLSLICLSLSALSGLACVLTRLYDFRGTAKRARGRHDAPTKETLDRIGRATIALFHAQCGAFIVGIVAIAAALLLTSGRKTDKATSEDPRALLDVKKKCVEAGERVRPAYFATHPACTDTLSAPRYAYNSELKTCLYADRCLGTPATPVAQYFVMDAFSNSILIQYDVGSGMFSGTLPGLPTQRSGEDAFKAKFRELFGSSAQAPE